MHVPRLLIHMAIAASVSAVSSYAIVKYTQVPTTISGGNMRAALYTCGNKHNAVPLEVAYMEITGKNTAVLYCKGTTPIRIEDMTLFVTTL